MSLVRFEAGRLLRSPLVWGAAVLMVALRVWQTWSRAPAWPEVTIDTAYGSLLVGAGASLAANLAVGRERRHGVPETIAALPVRAPARTRALLVAAPAVAALVACAAVALHLLSLLPAHPAGRFDAWEALTGPAGAAIGAVLGVAAGRWLPGPAAGPIVLFAVAAPLELSRGGGSWAGLLPVILHHDLPVEINPRPSGAHLVYLLALVPLIAALAMSRHGARPRRLLVALAGLAVAVPTGATAAGGTHDAVPAERLARWMTPAAQRCRVVEEVRYCAYPGYEPWIPLWTRAVRPVVAALPPAGRSRVPEIRQRVGDVSAGQGRGTMMKPTWPHPTGPFFLWGRNGTEPLSRAWLAGQVAARVTGLPEPDYWHLPVGDPLFHAGGLSFSRGTPGCAGWRQARTLVALWLGGQAGPVRTAASSWAETTDSERPAAERLYRYAERLMERPDTRARVQAHWATLTDPETTVEQALPLLGLTPDTDDRKDCS
ncbi:hypothetical protein F5972_24270 [Microbispora cellulosiformans]|uniref:Uncharacterized protein n=1 Tax=Microbispora cellulosiformans TaxID=2614688 RepID=A0A5J5K1K1_9ACTN|nr:hypothetical protein [Microbispora cellulosiformans]KAA9376522.1 hypothetical protein F5972_24270 [Microbispora cellulosiformans]